MTERGFATKAVHAGESPDPTTGASAPNIVMSSTYTMDEPAGFSVSAFEGERPYVYTRWDNPTIRMLETKLAELEQAEACLSFASGMAASAALLQGTLKSGDHIVASDVHYAGTAELIRGTVARGGVSSTLVDTTDLDMVRDALTDRTKLIWLESPANPILKITDIQAVADLAHGRGVLVVVDSTFATPCVTRPVELGADFVVHSLTKYIGGHGDAIGGALLGARDELVRIRDEVRVHVGGVISPFNAWLIARGVATLPLRMKQHSASAQQVAEYLEAHSAVNRVLYPGLPSHPQFDLAQRQMELSSGILSFQIADGYQLASRFAKELDVIHYAVSVGHQRSLIYWLDTKEMLSTAFALDDELTARYQDYAGEGIFRLSVGLEDAEDLIDDLAGVIG